MGAKASKDSSAEEILKRAERMLDGLQALRERGRLAEINSLFSSMRKTFSIASNLSKSFGSLDIFAAVDLAIDKGSKLSLIGLKGSGKIELQRTLTAEETPDTGLLEPGHGLKICYLHREHETPDVNKRVLENMQYSAAQFADTYARKVSGSFCSEATMLINQQGCFQVEKTGLAMAILVVSGANFFT